MINIQIKGSCVTREAFNYIDKIDKDNNKDINVKNYIFQKPIPVLGSKKIECVNQKDIDKIKTNLINSGSVRNFVVKQVDTSFNKNYIKNNEDEDNYFVMDFIDERMKCIEIQGSYIEYRKEILDVIKKYDYKIIEYDFDLFKKYFDNFMNKVLEYYPMQKIILNKAFATLVTKSGSNIIPHTKTFKNYNDKKIQGSYSVKRGIEANKRLNQIYDYIIEAYPDIKIIELPMEKYYSEIDHKFGRGYYHYNEQYYIDFMNSLFDIIDGSEDVNMKNQIATENKYYIHLIEEKIKLSEILIEKIGINNVQKEINLDELVMSHNNSFISNTKVYSQKKTIVQFSRTSSEYVYTVFNDNQDINTKVVLDNEEKLKTIETYSNGKKSTLINIDDNRICSVNKYNDQEIKIEDINMDEYINIGIPNSRTIYDKKGKKLEYLRYYGTGVISSKTIYDDNGRYKKSLFYNQRGKIKMERFYYITKNKKLDRYYKDGVLTKSEAYFPSGQKREIITYDKDKNILKRSYRQSELDEFIEDTIM